MKLRTCDIFLDIKNSGIFLLFDKYFLIFVDYEIVTEENDQAIYTQERYVIIRSVEIRPIETISWDNLHIQALGKGQLQLKDAHDPIKQYPYDRQEWMGTLKWAALDFIDKQQAKLCKYRQNWV